MPPGEMTVIELVTRYMNLKRSLKENSFRAYDSVINRIREDPFGQKQIRHEVIRRKKLVCVPA